MKFVKVDAKGGGTHMRLIKLEDLKDELAEDVHHLILGWWSYGELKAIWKSDSVKFTILSVRGNILKDTRFDRGRIEDCVVAIYNDVTTGRAFSAFRCMSDGVAAFITKEIMCLVEEHGNDQFLCTALGKLNDGIREQTKGTYTNSAKPDSSFSFHRSASLANFHAYKTKARLR